MKFRKLRIAWSVVCVVLCVSLMVLWVCGYWYVYSAIRLVSPTTSACCLIQEGQFELNWTSDPVTVSLVARNGPGWTGGITALEDFYVDDGTEGDGPHPFGSPMLRRFAFDQDRIVIPLWFPTVLFGTFFAAPWVRWSKRFSLRTLLIATTLVAIALGTIVYVVGN